MDIRTYAIRCWCGALWSNIDITKHARNLPSPDDDAELPSMLAFGINDVYDYPSDLVNPRKSATSAEGIILPPTYHRFIIQAAVISSALLIGISFLPYRFAFSLIETEGASLPVISTALLVVVMWVYSAPPFRLKERPVLDSLSNGLIIWLVWFIGFISSSTLAGTGHGLKDTPLEIYMLSLAASSVHALAAAADVEADRAAGYRTIAIVLGRRGCAVFGSVVYALALSTQSISTVMGAYFAGGLVVMTS
ncbi:hypothetical protein FRC07_013220, partial [Ceratobasidium sp. 392]